MSRFYGLGTQVYQLPADRRPVTVEQIRTAEPLANSFQLTDLTMVIGHVSHDVVVALCEKDGDEDGNGAVHVIGYAQGHFRHAWVLFDQHSAACYALVCHGDRCTRLHPGQTCDGYNTQLLDQPEGHRHADSPYLHPRLARRSEPGALSWVAVPVHQFTEGAVPVTLAEIYIRGDGDLSWAKEADSDPEGGQ